MKHNEFANQMGRLVDVYGDKAYPSPRTDLIFKWASRMELVYFEAIVSKLIAENDRAPMLNKFKDAFFELGIAKEIKKVDCPYCAGGGFIPDDNPLPNVYRCRCSVGESMPRYIAQWKGMLKRIVPTQGELNWRNVSTVIKTTIKGME